jgi:hypothetical protein
MRVQQVTLEDLDQDLTFSQVSNSHMLIYVCTVCNVTTWGSGPRFGT